MSTEFSAPQSRNEAILQNILGANNVIKPPFSRIEVLLIALLEELSGGTGTDSNAVHYTEDTGKTSTEKATARTNINADVKKFVVTVDTSVNPITASKTWLELNDAIVDGSLCVAEDDVYTYYLVDFDDELSVAYFMHLRYDNSTGKLLCRTLRVTSSNAWNLYESSYDYAPQNVVDLDSTSITIASAEDNTIYKYGTLSALTVTDMTNGEFIIKFTSGSTATNTNFPASMKFPDDYSPFAADTNTRYEISVSEGYAAVGKWSTT